MYEPICAPISFPFCYAVHHQSGLFFLDLSSVVPLLALLVPLIFKLDLETHLVLEAQKLV